MEKLKQILDAYRNKEREFPSYGELWALADDMQQQFEECMRVSAKWASAAGEADGRAFNARANALEEAALICDEFESDFFDAYKGRGKYEPLNPHRGDIHFDGKSDGAGQCADAIRALAKGD